MLLNKRKDFFFSPPNSNHNIGLLPFFPEVEGNFRVAVSTMLHKLSRWRTHCDCHQPGDPLYLGRGN